MTDAGIAVRALAKRYGDIRALAGVDLDVAPGEVLGLLGPNGAGKTTTLEAIAGLVVPDGGSISVAGVDALARPNAARRLLGIVLQETGLPAKITPREALRAFAVLQDVAPDIDALLGRFGLAGKAGAFVETLSGGQRQRLALALAFVGDPPAVLLDEPTAGLDPAMRREVQDHVRAIHDEGRAVLLATHDMAEAERLCDRVALISGGRIVASGTPASLVGGAPRQVTARLDAAPPGGWPATIAGIGAITGEGATVRFAGDALNAVLPALAAWADGERLALVEVQAGAPSLEDVIVSLGRR